MAPCSMNVTLTVTTWPQVTTGPSKRAATLIVACGASSRAPTRIAAPSAGVIIGVGTIIETTFEAVACK